MLELKREEVTRDSRNLHNKDLHNSYSSSDTIVMITSKWMRWLEYIACMGEMRNSYKILVRKSEEKRPLGRLKYR